jgi:hypothetical protein
MYTLSNMKGSTSERIFEHLTMEAHHDLTALNLLGLENSFPYGPTGVPWCGRLDLFDEVCVISRVLINFYLISIFSSRGRQMPCISHSLLAA